MSLKISLTHEQAKQTQSKAALATKLFGGFKAKGVAPFVSPPDSHSGDLEGVGAGGDHPPGGGGVSKFGNAAFGAGHGPT